MILVIWLVEWTPTGELIFVVWTTRILEDVKDALPRHESEVIRGERVNWTMDGRSVPEWEELD